MANGQKIPIYRSYDKELLGFIMPGSVGWEAQTIFGYAIERVEDKNVAEAIVREQGPTFLKGIWQYLDIDDREWHSCVLKKAYEHHVTVVRTNAMGFQDPDDYKMVIITDPSETNLIKS